MRSDPIGTGLLTRVRYLIQQSERAALARMRQRIWWVRAIPTLRSRADAFVAMHENNIEFAIDNLAEFLDETIVDVIAAHLPAPSPDGTPVDTSADSSALQRRVGEREPSTGNTNV